MSDTDDGFDEEAVREELREKYEDEQEDREATARMSELLLQGATMTNDHCDRCGTPIFRYDGQAFCPTCQHEAREQAQEQQANGQQTRQGQQADGQQTQQEQQEQQTQQEEFGQQPGQHPDQSAEGSSADGQQPPATAESGDRRAPPAQSDATPPAQTDPERAPGARDGPRSRDDPDSRDLPEHAPTARARAANTSGEAADALESTIAALSRRAASADDPRTAREYLEAAREAAEALAALR